MITALPDIKKISLQPDDEFMVLACDGIWYVKYKRMGLSFRLMMLTQPYIVSTNQYFRLYFEDP